jgi:hypothetical protein
MNIYCKRNLIQHERIKIYLFLHIKIVDDFVSFNKII